MNFLTGSNDLGTLGLGLLIAGATAGLFSGVLGRGAGLILVPALFLVARALGMAPALAMPLAAGTALACLVPLTLMALAGRTSGLNRAAVLLWALPVAAAVAGGAVLVLRAPGNWRCWPMRRSRLCGGDGGVGQGLRRNRGVLRRRHCRSGHRHRGCGRLGRRRITEVFGWFS